MPSNLPDIQTLIAAGMDPRTHLPIKIIESNAKEGVKKLLRVIDEQDAVNRYNWIGCPPGLTPELIERVLYYRGMGVLFYVEADKKFFFLPFCLNGTIDCYGRFRKVSPLPFVGTSQTKGEEFIPGLVLDVYYELAYEELTKEQMLKSGVILYDYCRQLSQTILPRKDLQEPLLDVMSECVPLMRTNLISTSGIRGWRVPDADAKQEAFIASRAVKDAALNGEPFIPVESATELQELSTGSVGSKSEEYMMALQSLDNFRLSVYGIENGGLFEKKAHVLNSEESVNGQTAGIIYNDGLRLRQEFCDIVNSIWDIGIWCEPSENVMGVDLNGDGAMYDSQVGGVENGTNDESI